MIIDPVATAGLVTREVRSGSRDGAPTKIAIARRTYPTDQADLWDALTNAERIPRWFLPVSGDLSVGGRYQLEGNAGGTIERCEEPESFAVTWEYGQMLSWLEVTLTPAADGTDPRAGPRGARRARHVGAVRSGRGRRRLGPRPDRTGPPPRERSAGRQGGGRSVPHHARGRRVHTPGGDGLGRRRRSRDGDEPGPAHEAAERTVAFYTTPPEDV